MKFIASFCDPTKHEMIDLGNTSEEVIIDQFEKIDWNAFLEKMRTTRMDDIYSDPSFVVEDIESKNNLVVSAVGQSDIYEFRITYNRAQIVKSFLGLNDKIDHLSKSIFGQEKNDAIDCLKALLRNDVEYLSIKFGL